MWRFTEKELEPRNCCELRCSGSISGYDIAASRQYQGCYGGRRRACESYGSASGENGLAYMYTDGLGIPLDYPRAYSWYGRAAEQGNAKEEYNLGNMYCYGRGVAQKRVG